MDGYIPYDPRSDPRFYAAQGLQNLLGGILQQAQQKQLTGDISSLLGYGQYQQQMQQALTGQQAAQQLPPEAAQGMMTPAWPEFQQFPQLQSPQAQQLAIQGLLRNLLMSPESQVGKLPGWWPQATTEQRQAYMDRVGGPLVQIGQKLLEPEQREEIAMEDYRGKVELGPSESKTAINNMKDIIWEMSTGKRSWVPGLKNYDKGRLIEAYKQYQVQNNYNILSLKKRKSLDLIWDNQIKIWNKTGYEKIGKNEFDWDPEDSNIKALRKNSMQQTKSPYPKYPDAFLENDIWKVMRNGKKYRIEE